MIGMAEILFKPFRIPSVLLSAYFRGCLRSFPGEARGDKNVGNTLTHSFSFFPPIGLSLVVQNSVSTLGCNFATTQKVLKTFEKVGSPRSI